MAENCTSCGEYPHKSYTKYTNVNTTSCNECTPTDASCVTYSGVRLGNLNIDSNSNLEYILQEIDNQINSGSEGVWNYNYSCLDDSTQITNRRQFVEEVSRQVCLLKTSVTSLQDTLPSLLSLESRVYSLEYPQYTSSSFIGVVGSDSSTVITNKFAQAIDSLNTGFNITSVNWSQNYPVTTPPTTLPQGFNEVLRQIGLLQTSVSSLTGVGTFDTRNYCIPTKTENTTLNTVITELLAEDCRNAKFEYPQVTWGCVTAPSTDTFQASFQKVVSVLGAVVEEKSVFDPAHFNVTPLSNCEGSSVSINEDLFNSDGKVYVRSSSLDKHFLSDILVEGTNVSFDVTDDTITINSQSQNEGKVAIDSASTPGYLEDVVIGGDYQGMITINPTTDSNGQMTLNPSINEELLTDMILNTIQSNPTLMNKLCNLLCGCQNTCT